jgi:hypothetical protein
MPTVEMAVFAQIRKYSPTVCPVNSRQQARAACAAAGGMDAVFDAT